MEMTKKRLEDYRSKKDEIPEVQEKLKHLGEGDSMIDNDVILDYRKGYPMPQSIVGYDYERYNRLKESYVRRLTKLQKECMEVELWIEDIPDSLTRRIFRMFYVDRMPQSKISKTVHLTQSKISEKITNYLKSG